MKPTTELFDLIKSLNRNEKRYFKLHASMQKGTKHYLNLFDAIDSLKIYDERFLKDKHKKESFTKNLTYNKNYLTRLIFKSLNFYSNEDSIESRLGNILKRCKILFEKALIKEYFKTVQLGKKIAKENEMFPYILEFLEMERQLTPKEQIGKKDVNQIYNDEIEVINKILNINLFQRSVSALFDVQRREGIIRSKSAEAKVNNILSKVNFEKIRNLRSRIALERFYFAFYLGNEIKGSFAEAYKFNQKRYSLISANGNLFQKFIYDNRRTALLSLMQSASAAKKFSSAKNLFGKYEDEYKTKRNFELRSQIVLFDIELRNAINNRECVDPGFLTTIEKVLSKYKGKINIFLYNLLYYNISRYYFVNEQYIESLRVINILFENKFLKHTPSLEPYTRILNLLIHYELKNYKLLYHLISSTTKYLKNKDRLFKTEKTVLTFLKKKSDVNAEPNTKNIFLELKKEFEFLKKDKYERNAYEYFDYLEWVNKKQ